MFSYHCEQLLERTLKIYDLGASEVQLLHQALQVFLQNYDFVCHVNQQNNFFTAQDAKANFPIQPYHRYYMQIYQQNAMPSLADQVPQVSTLKKDNFYSHSQAQDIINYLTSHQYTNPYIDYTQTDKKLFVKAMIDKCLDYTQHNQKIANMRMCVPIPFMLQDKQLQINLFNEQHSLFTQMLGYTAAPFLDMKFDDVTYQDFDDEFKNFIQRASNALVTTDSQKNKDKDEEEGIQTVDLAKLVDAALKILYKAIKSVKKRQHTQDPIDSSWFGYLFSLKDDSSGFKSNNQIHNRSSLDIVENVMMQITSWSDNEKTVFFFNMHTVLLKKAQSILNRLRFIEMTNLEKTEEQKLYFLDPKGYEQTLSAEEHNKQQIASQHHDVMGLLLISQQSLTLSRFYGGTLPVDAKHEKFDQLFQFLVAHQYYFLLSVSKGTVTRLHEKDPDITSYSIINLQWCVHPLRRNFYTATEANFVKKSIDRNFVFIEWNGEFYSHHKYYMYRPYIQKNFYFELKNIDVILISAGTGQGKTAQLARIIYFYKRLWRLEETVFNSQTFATLADDEKSVQVNLLMPTIDSIQTSYAFLAQSEFEVNDANLTVSSIHDAVYGVSATPASEAPLGVEGQLQLDKKKIAELRQYPYAVHKVLDSHTSKGKSLFKSNFDLVLMQTDGIMISSVIRSAFLDKKLKEPLQSESALLLGGTRQPLRKLVIHRPSQQDIQQNTQTMGADAQKPSDSYVSQYQKYIAINQENIATHNITKLKTEEKPDKIKKPQLRPYTQDALYIKDNLIIIDECQKHTINMDLLLGFLNFIIQIYNYQVLMNKQRVLSVKQSDRQRVRQTQFGDIKLFIISATVDKDEKRYLDMYALQYPHGYEKVCVKRIHVNQVEDDMDEPDYYAYCAAQIKKVIKEIRIFQIHVQQEVFNMQNRLTYQQLVRPMLNILNKELNNGWKRGDDILLFSTGSAEVRQLYVKVLGITKNIVGKKILVIPIYSAMHPRIKEIPKMRSEMDGDKIVRRVSAISQKQINQFLESDTLLLTEQDEETIYEYDVFIIISTNMYEESVTLDRLFLVIDPGFFKSVFSELNQFFAMDKMINKDSAKQREGRVGRKRDGRYIRLFNYDLLTESSTNGLSFNGIKVQEGIREFIENNVEFISHLDDGGKTQVSRYFTSALYPSDIIEFDETKFIRQNLQTFDHVDLMQGYDIVFRSLGDKIVELFPDDNHFQDTQFKKTLLLVGLLCDNAEDRSLSTPLLLHIVYSLLFRKSIYDIREVRARSTKARFFIDLKKTMQNINKLYQSHMANYVLIKNLNSGASPNEELPRALIINPQLLSIFKACTIARAAFALKDEIIFTIFDSIFTRCFESRETCLDHILLYVDNARAFIESKNNTRRDFIQQYSMCMILQAWSQQWLKVLGEAHESCKVLPVQINIIDLLMLFYADKFTVSESKNNVTFFEDMFSSVVKRNTRKLFVQERERLQDSSRNMISSFYCLTYSELEQAEGANTISFKNTFRLEEKAGTLDRIRRAIANNQIRVF